MSESFEHAVERYSREIFYSRNKIIDDFYKAYASQLSYFKNEMINLDDICLIEQIGCFVDGKPVSKWWFEYKPKFKDE